MRSAVATTFELDDARVSAQELVDSIQDQLEFKEHSAGILLCDADADGAAISSELNRLLGIPIAGMTSLATFSTEGYHDGAVTLTVFTADDVRFTLVASAPFDDSYEEEMADAYRRALPTAAPDVALDERPALIFAFCPSSEPFSGDKYANTLGALAHDAPVIGGICSDYYEYKHARVFLNGEEYTDSIVLVCLWGEVRPTFSIRHVTSKFAERIRRVVEARDNIVYRVGDETFVEYLEGFGLRTDVSDPLMAFTSYPMMLTQEAGDETPLMRHIAALDLETGAGTFIADVPVGALANICLISRDDIKVSARESMESLLTKMAEQHDYEYSTVFCVSCGGRSVILGADSGAEGDILAEQLPEGLVLAGAYCMGELCPTRYVDGVARNRFHNCSITFCAL
ncbi:MAG: FIST C-terminal domain-containing protein [Coriobacteriales bacterium]|jgi:hypothetical protein|nr:FIST C-terminal domain-containing protein [Coriobacteriales bacterium]